MLPWNWAAKHWDKVSEGGVATSWWWDETKWHVEKSGQKIENKVEIKKELQDIEAP